MKRNIRSNKRGVALEMAISFLLLIFALCSLMTTLALVSRSRLDLKKTSFMQTVELQQIGESFCDEVYQKKIDPEFPFSSNSAAGYYSSWSKKTDVGRDVYTLRVYTEKNPAYPKLVVTVYADEDGPHILSWTRFDYEANK